MEIPVTVGTVTYAITYLLFEQALKTQQEAIRLQPTDDKLQHRLRTYQAALE